MTSFETLKYSAVTCVAVLKTLLAKVIVKVMNEYRTVVVNFLLLGQLIGFSGSSGPVHLTT